MNNDKFSVKEYALALDSPPGWEVIPDFIHSLYSSNVNFDGWLCDLDHKQRRFMSILDTSIEHKFQETVLNCIKQCCYILIKCKDGGHLKCLYDNYTMTSEECTSIEQLYNLLYFPKFSLDELAHHEGFDLEELFNLENEYVVVVFNHDGEPVYIIKEQ
ncbi:MAG: hypothetical protein HZC51_07860 [Nitrospirae bacterium]|nr:hypothetical protein [Nitrospirota bacterium]